MQKSLYFTDFLKPQTALQYFTKLGLRQIQNQIGNMFFEDHPMFVDWSTIVYNNETALVSKVLQYSLIKQTFNLKLNRNEERLQWLTVLLSQTDSKSYDLNVDQNSIIINLSQNEIYVNDTYQQMASYNKHDKFCLYITRQQDYENIINLFSQGINIHSGNFNNFTPNLNRISQLKHLVLKNCVCPNLCQCKNLQGISLYSVISIRYKDFSKLGLLRILYLSNIQDVQYLLQEMGTVNQLEYLYISYCDKQEEFVVNMNFPRLRYLLIYDSFRFVKINSGKNTFSNLKYLDTNIECVSKEPLMLKQLEYIKILNKNQNFNVLIEQQPLNKLQFIGITDIKQICPTTLNTKHHAFLRVNQSIFNFHKYLINDLIKGMYRISSYNEFGQFIGALIKALRQVQQRCLKYEHLFYNNKTAKYITKMIESLYIS